MTNYLYVDFPNPLFSVQHCQNFAADMSIACADNKILPLCLSTDQVWKGRVGGRLGVLREEV